MNRKNISTRLFTLSALTLILLFTACQRKNIHQVIEEMAEMPVDTTGFVVKQIQTNDFSWVEIECFADVTYIQTPIEEESSIEISALAEVLEHIKTKVDEGRLRISVNHRYQMPKKAVIKATIRAPFVNKFIANGIKCLRIDSMRLSSPLEIELDGVGSLIAEKIETPESKLQLTGAGNVKIEYINTRVLQTSLNGVGNIKIGGECESVIALLQGKGEINFSKLKTKNEIAQTINGNGKIIPPTTKQNNNK